MARYYGCVDLHVHHPLATIFAVLATVFPVLATIATTHVVLATTHVVLATRLACATTTTSLGGDIARKGERSRGV